MPTDFDQFYVAAGNRIKERRLAVGLSRIDVAELTGKRGYSIVTKWENGERLPTLKDTVALCEILGCTVNDIAYGEDHDQA